jgi:hypothetical protein
VRHTHRHRRGTRGSTHSVRMSSVDRGTAMVHSVMRGGIALESVRSDDSCVRYMFPRLSRPSLLPRACPCDCDDPAEEWFGDFKISAAAVAGRGGVARGERQRRKRRRHDARVVRRRSSVQCTQGDVHGCVRVVGGVRRVHGVAAVVRREVRRAVPRRERRERRDVDDATMRTG